MLGKIKTVLLLMLTLAELCGADDFGRTPVGTSCTQPRVRKSWDAFTPDDKKLYLCALSRAMDTGYHQKFVELYTDTLSELEAHRTCVFIYWHRMFLLGYENMLRSFGPEYRCITIPYWDHLSATSRIASGSCDSIEECAPILADFGGTSRGFVKSLKVYDATIPVSEGDDQTKVHSLCVNQGPLAHFCGNNTKCAHCVPRGRGGDRKNYPTEAFFGSVYQQVFRHDEAGEFTNAVERGIHDTIFSKMGGALQFLQSPVDPLFYAHLATSDLLQTIFLKCQNGEEGVFLSSEEKNSGHKFWGCSCERGAGGSFTGTDVVTMLTKAFDGTKVPVRESKGSMLYPFFKDLPATYGEYVDAKDLGPYSYTYSFSGALTNMYKNCNDSITQSASTITVDEREDESDNMVILQDKSELATQSAFSAQENEQDAENVLTPTLYGTTEVDDKMRRWMIAIYEAARLVGYNISRSKEQMEMVTCQYQQECIGDTDDYSDMFRSNYGVEGHSRCFVLVKALASGDSVIGIPDWREITKRFLACPLRKKIKSKMVTLE